MQGSASLQAWNQQPVLDRQQDLAQQMPRQRWAQTTALRHHMAAVAAALVQGPLLQCKVDSNKKV